MAMDWDALTEGFMQGFRLYQDYKRSQLQQEILKNELERRKLELEKQREERERRLQQKKIDDEAARRVFGQNNQDQPAQTGDTQQAVPEAGPVGPAGDTKRPTPNAAPDGQTGDDRLYQAEAIPVAPQSKDNSSPWPPVAAQLGAAPQSANVGAETAQAMGAGLPETGASTAASTEAAKAMGAQSAETGTSPTAGAAQAMGTKGDDTGVGLPVGSTAQAMGTRSPKTGVGRPRPEDEDEDEPFQLGQTSVLANDPHTKYQLERMRIAAERGNGALYQQYFGDYANHVAKRLTLAKNKAEHKLVALTSQLNQMRARGQINMLSDEQRAAYLQLLQNYGRISRETMATGIYLYQNAATRQQGLRLLGAALDTAVKDIVVDGDFLVPVGKDGKPVTWEDGKQVRLHKDAAERMVQEIVPREKPITVPPGAIVINPSGRVVFENKNNRPGEANSSIQLARKMLGDALEVKTDAMGNLVAGTPPNIQRIHGELTMKAAKLIDAGMKPHEAAEYVYREYREAQAQFPNKENVREKWRGSTPGGATTRF